MRAKPFATILLASLVNGAAFVVDGNLAAAAGAMIATVVITLSVVNWIDGRIEHKIRNYANVVKWQHRSILQEISNLRELQGHPPLDIDSILEEEKKKEAS